jgi:dienelactone hydrolase
MHHLVRPVGAEDGEHSRRITARAAPPRARPDAGRRSGLRRAAALGLSVVAAFLGVGCGGGGGEAETCAITGPYGEGRGQVSLLRPSGDPESIVVFGHGWTDVEPTDWHLPRLDHLCAEGSLVVFPRYQVDEFDTFENGVDGFRDGLRTAFSGLVGVDVPVVAVGYSLGGALVSYYAGHAAEWEVPAPESVLSIFPTARVPGRPAGTPPVSVTFVVLAGDADEVVGTAGADDLRAWLESNGRRMHYRLVRSNDALTASHEALKETTDASTETFWAPIDDLVADAREGR